MKAQAVRLVDVFLLGPLMIAAAGAEELGRPARLVLAVAGVLTITYNATNFLELERRP